MKLLLDSDIISALCKPEEKEQYTQAENTINSFPENFKIYISIITFYEIQYGINADNDTERAKRIKTFIHSAKKHFITLGLQHDDSEVYGVSAHKSTY